MEKKPYLNERLAGVESDSASALRLINGGKAMANDALTIPKEELAKQLDEALSLLLKERKLIGEEKIALGYSNTSLSVSGKGSGYPDRHSAISAFMEALFQTAGPRVKELHTEVQRLSTLQRKIENQMREIDSRNPSKLPPLAQKNRAKFREQLSKDYKQITFTLLRVRTNYDQELKPLFAPERMKEILHRGEEIIIKETTLELKREAVRSQEVGIEKAISEVLASKNFLKTISLDKVPVKAHALSLSVNKFNFHTIDARQMLGTKIKNSPEKSISLSK